MRSSEGDDVEAGFCRGGGARFPVPLLCHTRSREMESSLCAAQRFCVFPTFHFSCSRENVSLVTFLTNADRTRPAPSRKSPKTTVFQRGFCDFVDFPEILNFGFPCSAVVKRRSEFGQESGRFRIPEIMECSPSRPECAKPL